MKHFAFTLVFALATAGMALANVVSGGPASEFMLKDTNGKTHRLSDFKGRFVVLEVIGRALGHRAEAAGAGADVAEDHERRGLAGPALGAVGALRALADRFELEVVDEVLGEEVAVPFRDGPLEPVRQAAIRFGGFIDERQ